MKSKEKKMMLADIKAFMRDFKLNELMQNTGNKIEVVAPKKRLLSFLWPGNKKIKQLNSLGAVITGSRALTLFRINGEPLLDRKVRDWDFLLDRKNFLRFCGLNSLTNLQYGIDRITVNLTTGMYVFDTGYHTSEPRYLFRHDFDIISKEDLPLFYEIDGFRVSTLEHIFQEKIKLIEDDIDSEKHLRDCIQIMTKLEAFSK